MNSSKIANYKESLINFIQIQKSHIDIEKITQIDYFVGILFLTNMNCYCKSNKLSVHGYYIAIAFINIFMKIRTNNITTIDIINFYESVSQQIEYLNRRLNDNIKNTINNSLAKYVIEVSRNLTKIIEYTMINEYNMKTDVNLLNNFFYVLLITAKFMGTGLMDEPNLFKIGEYYSNIFIVYLILIDNENVNNNEKQLLFNNYVDYKSKLKYSLCEMSLISGTTDEIMFYIDHFLMAKFG